MENFIKGMLIVSLTSTRHLHLNCFFFVSSSRITWKLFISKKKKKLNKKMNSLNRINVIYLYIWQIRPLKVIQKAKSKYIERVEKKI